MNEKITIGELYKSLKPAFLVKVRLLKFRRLDYIKMEDIWNYLKESKWLITRNLTIAEMVNDIIHLEAYDIDRYVKKNIYNMERKVN